MKIWYATVICGCLMGAGCAEPLIRDWDDPVYLSLQERFKAADDAQSVKTTAKTVNAGEFSDDIKAIDSLSLDDAIRIGIANSPRLRRAGYRVDISAGRVIQAGLYPNPSFAFDAEGLGSDDGSGGETIYRFEQEIVLGGKLSKAKEVARVDRHAAQAAFIAEEFAIASEVTRAYFSAVTARERLENRQLLIELADRLLQAATVQVEAGAATEPDRLRAEVVRERAEIDLASARQEADAALRELASVMGLPDSITIPLTTVAGELPNLPDQKTILASTLEANSRVTLATIAIERARKAYDLAKAEAIPNLVASVGPRYSDLDNETTLDVGLGIEIPIFDRNQGNIQAALAERLSNVAQLREVQLELIAEVSRAWAAYQSAQTAVSHYESQLLPEAERSLDLVRQAYEHGKTDYLRLLDAQQVVIESRIAYVDALQRLHEAAALLRELAQTEAPWRGSSTEQTDQERNEQ